MQAADACLALVAQALAIAHVVSQRFVEAIPPNLLPAAIETCGGMFRQLTKH
jgi:hypothetical protein